MNTQLVWLVTFLTYVTSYNCFNRNQLPQFLASQEFVTSVVILCSILTYLELFVPGLLGSIVLAFLLGCSTSEGKSRSQLGNFVKPLNFNKNILFWGVISVLIVLGLTVRLYNMGQFSITIDEHWHLGTSVGYLNAGTFKLWNFVTGRVGKPYTRALPFTWMVIESFRWGEIGLWWGRLPSLLAGILIFFPYLWICSKLGLNRLLQVIALALLIVTPYMISTSHWIRMYSWFTLLFLLSVGSFLKFITTKFLLKRVLWGLTTAILLLLAALFHKFTILLIFALSLFLVTEWITDTSPGKIFSASIFNSRFRRFLVANIVLVFVAIGTSFFLARFAVLDLSELQTPRWQNLLYGTYLIESNVGILFGGIALGSIFTTVTRTPTERLLLTCWFIPLLVTLFSSRIPPENRYVGYLYPVFLPCLVLAVHRVLKTALRSRTFYVANLVLLLVLLPLRSVPSTLHKTWEGNPVGLSYPGRTGKPFQKTLSSLKKRLTADDVVLVYDMPSYHVSQFEKETSARVLYVSSFRKNLSAADLKTLSSGQTGDRWAVISNWYRPPLTASVKSFLKQQFVQVEKLSGEWIDVYKSKKRKKG